MRDNAVRDRRSARRAMWEVEEQMGKHEASWPHAVTLVVAAENARQRGWAAATTIEIARKLGKARKVILVDVAARTPLGLAKTLGVTAGEGIVDVLFRGKTFASVASRPGSESFFFLPLGSAPPPLSVLYRHPRWKKIAARLGEAHAHLLPCVSAEDWLEAGPIPGFEPCIVLNALGADVELPGGARRLAEFLAPSEIREGAPPIEAPAPASVDGAHEMAPEASPKRAESMGREPTGRTDSELDLPLVVTEPAGWIPRRRHRPSRRGRARLGRGRAGSWTGAGQRLLAGLRERSLIPAAALVAAVAVAIALWNVIAGDRGPEPGSVGLEAAADTSAVSLVEPSVGARPEETTLPYSVAIASYSSYDDAIARQRELTRADLAVYVAPTPVRGVVYYRVLVGLMPGRAQAESLMAELVRRGIKDTVRAWDVRPARLAFNLGLYPTAEDARAAVESLLGQAVPAYMVPAAGATGGDGQAYRVYAGGYEAPEDSRALETMIEKAGLNIELVERVGLVLK